MGLPQKEKNSTKDELIFKNQNTEEEMTHRNGDAGIRKTEEKKENRRSID